MICLICRIFGQLQSAMAQFVLLNSVIFVCVFRIFLITPDRVREIQSGIVLANIAKEKYGTRNVTGVDRVGGTYLFLGFDRTKVVLNK